MKELSRYLAFLFPGEDLPIGFFLSGDLVFGAAGSGAAGAYVSIETIERDLPEALAVRCTTVR